jgi:hypothetical protein
MSSSDKDCLSDYKEVTSSDKEYTPRPKKPSKPSQLPGLLQPPRPYRILCTPLFAPASPSTVAQACTSFFDAQESLADGIQIWKVRAAEEKRVMLVAEDEMSFGVYEEWGKRMCVQKYWIEKTSGEEKKGRKKDGGKRDEEWRKGGKKGPPREVGRCRAGRRERGQ